MTESYLAPAFLSPNSPRCEESKLNGTFVVLKLTAHSPIIAAELV